MQSYVSNMAGVLFEDIFNVKDIDPEGKKFDRGESMSELTFRRIRALTCRSDARAIFIDRTVASRELLDLADSAGTTSTWCNCNSWVLSISWNLRNESYPLLLAVTAGDYNVDR